MEKGTTNYCISKQYEFGLNWGRGEAYREGKYEP